MARLMARFYDRCMRASERAGLTEWRRALLAGLDGDVLEVGAGTGVNLPLYPDGSAITRLVLSEPDPHMRRRLEAKLPPALAARVELSAGSLDALPFDDGAFDVVVGMLVLCSVRDPARALAEVRRVLRPGGRLVFLEHVRADEHAGQRLLQHCVQPLWRWIAGNCHLTRPTERLIRAAGFTVEEAVLDGMPKAPLFVRPTVRGVATRTAT